MASNEPTPDVDTTIQAYLNRADWQLQLATDYQDTATRLLTAYQRILPRLQEAANGFNTQVADYFAANGEMPSADRTRGFKTYQDLLTRVETEMQAFSAVVSNEAATISDQAIVTGVDAAEQTAQFTAGERAGIVASVWNRPAPEALAQVIQYVDSDVFRSKAAAFGANAAENLGNTILAGIAQGKNPVTTARIVNNWFNVPFDWAINAVATTQMYSYRAANHQSYVENSDIITSWMWWAALDDRTCLSCISQHGQIFPLTESLNDHHRGRCTELPIVVGSTWQNSVKRGEDWFAEQSPATQRGIMGPGRLELYQGGMWDWSRVSVPYQDDLFGRMLREATLTELSG